MDHCIFMLNPESLRTRHHHFETTSFYMQFKLNTFQKKVIVQIININDSIIVNQMKIQNEQLAMINACVSHEMRNPLNSVIAINIEKKSLLAQLVRSMKRGNTNPDSFVKQMEVCLDNQKCATQEMLINLQNLIDYSEIFTECFVKNYRTFNIKHAVKDVMDIQRQKAAEQKIVFTAEFVNIGDGVEEHKSGASLDSEMDVSPFVHTDLERYT